jgi:flavin reductase (DIM6/NTAB) family NADH-FMN oxidoreductase RutF
VLICVDNRSETNAGFRASGIFGVSVLAEGQEEISQRFAAFGSSKFGGLGLLKGRSGALLVPGALTHIECRLQAAHAQGDHQIYVGEVVHLAVNPGRPLLYHASGYRRLHPEETPET